MNILVKVLLSIFLLLPAVTIAVARATLPRNECDVTVGQIDKLGLETMSYADVKAALGCDGILKTREDFGGDELVLETYSWRIAAWPYGRFDGEFINGKMHGKLQLWFNLHSQVIRTDQPFQAALTVRAPYACPHHPTNAKKHHPSR